MEYNKVTSQRLQALPNYPFVRINELKKERAGRGLPLYDLGIGAPDMPTPQPIIDEFTRHLSEPRNHLYSGVYGNNTFLASIERYFEERFGINWAQNDFEALPTAGSKEALAHAPLAFINPGDTIMLPDPGYPVYRVARLWCEGQNGRIDLDQASWQLDPARLEKAIAAARAAGENPRLLYLNYPNNPTGAGIEPEKLAGIVKVIKHNKMILLYDNAYCEIYDPGSPAPVSIFNIEGAQDCCLEFHSLSKTFLMTGWRIGFIAGHRELISRQRRLKSNFDSGLFTPLQLAGAWALDHLKELSGPSREIFASRRQKAWQLLDSMKLEYLRSPYTFYIWIKAPLKDGQTSRDFTENALVEHGLITTPGTAFGDGGEGYFRISLCLDHQRLEEAMEVLQNCI